MASSVNGHRPADIHHLAADQQHRPDDAERNRPPRGGGSSIGYPLSEAGGGASILGGFNPVSAARTAASVISRFAGHSARFGRAHSVAPSSRTTPSRRLTEENLRALGDHLRNQVHDEMPLPGRAGRAARQYDPPDYQAHVQDRRAELDRTRFENQMAQMDQEEAQTRREQELAAHKHAHALQMHEYEKAKMEQEAEVGQVTYIMSKIQQFWNLIVGANKDAERMTSR